MPRTSSNSGDEDADTDGYDYDFIDDVHSKYICSICTKVMRDARLVECCGHHFCNFCLKKWQRQGRWDCPFCRAVNFYRVKNKEKMREINELRVQCINKGRGCGWVGELGSINNHLQSENGCLYVKVTCSNRAYKTISNKKIEVTCGAEMERQYLADHVKNECKYRKYSCEYCGYKDTYDAVAGTGRATLTSKMSSSDNHYSSCDYYPLECVNKCGVLDIKRQDMKSHRQVCRYELISCTYNCGHKIQRRRKFRHQIHCPYRPYKCRYCNKKGTYKSITGEGSSKEDSHHKVCQYYPLHCPNQCGSKGIKRKDMPRHREKCGLEPLDCPFKYAKCTRKILRCDMDTHCERNVQNHLLLMAEAHKELVVRCDDLVEKNKELWLKNYELTRTVEELTPSSPKRARLDCCLDFE